MQNETRVITKLNRDTKEGIVIWKISSAAVPTLSGSEALVDNVYTTKVLNKYFRVYRVKTRYYYDEDAYHLIDSYRLEFIDQYGKSEWTFPESNAIQDLYETVRFKTSNIESFMDEYLKDDQEVDNEKDNINPDLY